MQQARREKLDASTPRLGVPPSLRNTKGVPVGFVLTSSMHKNHFWSWIRHGPRLESLGYAPPDLELEWRGVRIFRENFRKFLLKTSQQ